MRWPEVPGELGNPFFAMRMPFAQGNEGCAGWVADQGKNITVSEIPKHTVGLVEPTKPQDRR